MNPIVKEIFLVTKQRECLVHTIELTLDETAKAIIEEIDKDTELLPEENLEETKAEILEDIHKITAALTEESFLDKLEEDAACVISEHISDETLEEYLKFTMSELGQKITQANFTIQEVVNKIAVARAKEQLAAKGL